MPILLPLYWEWVFSRNGFSQFIADDEKMDMKMIRLLKRGLTPHIYSCSLEIKYKQDDEYYEIIDSVKEGSVVDISLRKTSRDEARVNSTISSYDSKTDNDPADDVNVVSVKADNERFAHLPVVSPPSIL
jgi:hypothetical protein